MRKIVVFCLCLRISTALTSNYVALSASAQALSCTDCNAGRGGTKSCQLLELGLPEEYSNAAKITGRIHRSRFTIQEVVVEDCLMSNKQDMHCRFFRRRFLYLYKWSNDASMRLNMPMRNVQYVCFFPNLNAFRDTGCMNSSHPSDPSRPCQYYTC